MTVIPTIVSRENVSATFLSEIERSHQLGVLVQILDGNTGAILRELDQVVSGAVTIDSKAATRSRLDMEIVDDGSDGLLPTVATDDLAPFGNEARVCRGIVYRDGTSELVSLGIFRIRSADVSSSDGSRTIKVTGLDRWTRFTDARFEDPLTIAAGTNYVTAIGDLADDAYPGVTTDLGSTTLTTPLIVKAQGDDRGELMQEMALSLGQELYFDGSGVLTMRPIANVDSTIAFTFSEVLVEATKSWDADAIYNRVIASGEPIDDSAPVTGTATDDNPLSPTYYLGEFGKRPRFYVSTFVTTAAQALDAAAGILAGALGSSQRVTFGSVVNPAVDVGVPVRIIRSDLGLDEIHILDELAIPLTATETMSAGTRIIEVAA